MNINQKAVKMLKNNSKKGWQNLKSSDSSTISSCTMVTPAFSKDYPDYAYVPYNPSWGRTDSCCKNKETNEKNCPENEAFVPSSTFLSPDGQRWISEKNYIEYVSGMRIVYQCSDGTVAHSYQEFKDWECELAYHPHNPIYPTYPECNSTLSSIGYLELVTDGTIWRSQAMLEEYIHWQQDKTSGMENGVYVGNYGTASSFVEYSSLYNAAYYSNAGLKRDEQFYGAYGLLYSNAEQAQKSIDKLNSFQKVKK